MSNDTNRLRDAFSIAMEQARALRNDARIVGHGVVELRDVRGRLILANPFANQITTTGDQYYAKRGMAGVGTPNAAQPTLVTGMKLGTGTTAAAKSGAGAKLVAYLSGSNKLWTTTDTTFPQIVDEASDTGFSISYKITWAAGEATAAAITEAVITDAASTNADDADATHVISRVVFTAVNKGASDTLAITWKHTFNG